METRVRVPAVLRPWVADITAGSAGAAGVMVHPPDGASAVVVCRAAEAGPVVVVGPRSRAAYTAAKAASWVRIRLRPGRAGLVLATPARETGRRRRVHRPGAPQRGLPGPDGRRPRRVRRRPPARRHPLRAGLTAGIHR
ncbi:MAG TPA: hypothetical protein VGN37_27940 [Actinocatenispora sp.]